MKHLEVIVEDPDAGEQICACCGMVVNEKIPTDKGKLEKTKDNELRSHNMISLEDHHDYGLGTIADKSSDGSFKINFWQTRIRSNKNNGRLRFQRFNEFSARPRVPQNVKNIGLHLLRLVVNKGLTKGMKSEPLNFAILYFAFCIADKKMTNSKFVSEFGKFSKASKKYCKIIEENFNIKTNTPDNILNHIYFLANKIPLRKKQFDVCLQIYDKLKSEPNLSRKPKSIAGMIVYLMVMETNDQEIKNDEIAELLKLSRESIPRIKKDLTPILNKHGIKNTWRKTMRISDLG